ncbi:MAG: sensor histidine kinase [Deferribacterales bacterium]
MTEHSSNILSSDTVSMLNALPFSAALLNNEYRLIYGNEALMAQTNITDPGSVTDSRPGNFFKCINTEGGLKCGSTNKCCDCALNRFLETYEQVKEETAECRIISKTDTSIMPLDLRIHLKPINVSHSNHLLLILENISEIKQKELLNKTFLHDVLNTAGGLTSLLEYIKMSGTEEDFPTYLNLIIKQSSYLVEEIKSHKHLLNKDTANSLEHEKYFISTEILNTAVDIIRYYAAINNTSIEMVPDSDDVVLHCNCTMLRRVLVNLFKNAVEAAGKDEVIKAGCRLIEDKAVFFIKNDAVMDEMSRNAVFNKIYSSKEFGNGLGTQSIKLITEKYLFGTVHFESDEETGTIFYISVPLAENAKKS